MPGSPAPPTESLGVRLVQGPERLLGNFIQPHPQNSPLEKSLSAAAFSLKTQPFSALSLLVHPTMPLNPLPLSQQCPTSKRLQRDRVCITISSLACWHAKMCVKRLIFAAQGTLRSGFHYTDVPGSIILRCLVPLY